MCTYEFLVRFIKKMQQNPEFYKNYPELKKLVSDVGLGYFENLCKENGKELSSNDIIKKALSIYKEETQKFKEKYKNIKYNKNIEKIFKEGQLYGN